MNIVWLCVLLGGTGGIIGVVLGVLAHRERWRLRTAVCIPTMIVATVWVASGWPEISLSVRVVCAVSNVLAAWMTAAMVFAFFEQRQPPGDSGGDDGEPEEAKQPRHLYVVS